MWEVKSGVMHTDFGGVVGSAKDQLWSAIVA
jgi:hypothetical protein